MNEILQWIVIGILCIPPIVRVVQDFLNTKKEQ